MAVAMVIEWPGVDQEAYLALLRELDLGERMFPGAVLHLAGPVEGGWRAVDVWDSPEAFERFLREKLVAASARAGLPAPKVDTWPVFSLATPQGRPAPAE